MAIKTNTTFTKTQKFQTLSQTQQANITYIAQMNYVRRKAYHNNLPLKNNKFLDHIVEYVYKHYPNRAQFAINAITFHISPYYANKWNKSTFEQVQRDLNKIVSQETLANSRTLDEAINNLSYNAFDSVENNNSDEIKRNAYFDSASTIHNALANYSIKGVRG